MAVPRGAFIVFEGIDRCGKSTQCTRLVDALNKRGIKALATRFPERTTTIGQLINSYLTNGSETEDHAIHLLFSANRWELKEKIKKSLAAGETIVCDRYAYSGVAFSSAKGLDLEWCKDPDRGLPRPDLVLYLELSVDDALKRGNFGAERYEKEDFQRKVADKFMKLKESDWGVIDARLSPEAIAAEIESKALVAIAQAKTTNLKEDLWLTK